MKVGKYTLYSIETSRFGLDGGAMFGIIPKILWEKEAPADEYNRIQMVTRSLLLVSDERKIIIDTGNGDKWDDKAISRYNIDLDAINLSSSLAKYGFIPADITDVFCTHLHFDHCSDRCWRCYYHLRSHYRLQLRRRTWCNHQEYHVERQA